MTYQTPDYHPAFEEYCETIFELEEDNLKVIQARIAERLDVSRPAVSEMIKRMSDEGLLKDGSNGVVLTSRGMELATRVVRRHRLAECFLTDVLGLSWSDAHHEAGKWEHVISNPVEEAMIKMLEDPTTCPHGNPIPGSNYKEPKNLANLNDLPAGSDFVVERIPEELEFTEGLLEFLEQADIKPGNTGRVTAISPDGTTTVEIGGSHIGVGSFASERILVSVD